MPHDSLCYTSPLIAFPRKFDSHTLLAFIPPSSQTAYLALRVFNIETSRIADVGSNPIVASMRLRLWRDNISRTFAGSPLKQPVSILLAHFFSDLDARTQGKGEITDHAASNSSLLGGTFNAQHQTQEGVTLPLHVMAKAGVRDKDVLKKGAEVEGLRDAVYEVVTRVGDYLVTALQMLQNVYAGEDVGYDDEHEGDEEH
ncbi:hypothetical protein MMC28_007370 [Mycoblastus sanguinarius]|nr:hypothetical protein [Mycoblastus sanguinarius]